MKLFYSGAQSLDSEQQNPIKSLGGFRSSTMIPNGDLNSLFDDVSLNSIEERLKEVKVCYLKNTKTTSLSEITLFTEQSTDSPFSLRIGAVSGLNAELLGSKNQIPYGVQFYKSDSVFSYSDLICNKDFVPGETVVIEGQEIYVGDGKIESFLQNAIVEFDFNITYSAVIIDEKTLRIKYRNLEEYTNTPVVVTQEVDTITATDFGGFLDNSILLKDELEPEESICLFVMRIFDKQNKKTVEDWAGDFEKFRNNNFEEIESEEQNSVSVHITWGVPE